jgi:hypothetical protein
MTPMDVFLEELKKSGWAYTIVPGGQRHACARHDMKVIEIGRDVEEELRGVVGLHELGHAHTNDQFIDKNHPNFSAWMCRTNPTVRYAVEVAAWAWAESKMPPGYEKEFERAKEIGLETYRYAA